MFRSSLSRKLPHTTVRCFSSEARLVVSRRLWNKHRVPKQKESNPTKPEEEKPWPKNWLLFFYASAGTLIPYFGLWFVSANPTLREALLPVDDEGAFMKWIRSHFGHEDLHSISYSDYWLFSSNGQPPVEYRLPDEMSAAERALERQKEQTGDIPVRVGFVTESMGTFQLATEMKEHMLPASLPANPDALKEALKEIRKDDALEIMTGVPVVLFPNPVVEEEPESSDLIPSTQEDPLFQTHYSMSSWQVVDPAMIPEKKASAASWEDIERSRLEYELTQLQDEIRMGSTRSVDDVREELQRVKRELRKRTWKRWLPWSG